VARWDDTGDHLQFEHAYQRGGPSRAVRGSRYRPGLDPASAPFETLVLHERRPYLHHGASGSVSLGGRLLAGLEDASLAVVPLVADQRVVGLLAAARPPALPAWSEEEVEFLRTAADILATAMQHRTMRSHIRALSASAAGFNAGGDQQILLRRLAEAAIAVTGSNMGTVGLVEGSELIFRELWRRGRWEPADMRFEQDRGLAGWCWTNRVPCVVRDAATDVRIDPIVVSSWGVRSALAVPLLTLEGKAIGILELFNRVAGAAYGEEEVSLASALSQHAAMALALREARASKTGGRSLKARGAS
jgi:GAF domain-containing protein